MVDIGHRIRKIRRDQKLTLKQMSLQTKLSMSFLSQLERGIANPSVSSLKKIAQTFGISVVDFFVEKSDGFGLLPSSNAPWSNPSTFVQDIQVLRSDRRKSVRFPKSHVVYDLLTPDLNRQMEIMYMRISPGDRSGDEPVSDPRGEKFAFVLKGSLEVHIGDEIHCLHLGDSIYFPSYLPQSWLGVGRSPIEVIWALTPPCF